MAKITANGATEVARLKVQAPGGNEKLYVINSRGVILTRYTGEAGTGYNIRLRWNPRTMNFHTSDLTEILRAVVKNDGCTVI